LDYIISRVKETYKTRGLKALKQPSGWNCGKKHFSEKFE
jgi:hypothetical protein